MTQPTPPRKSCMTRSTISTSSDVSQPIYEDVDDLLPAVTDGIQSEGKVKPIPRPRSRVLSKPECNTDSNDYDSVSKTSNTTSTEGSQMNENPAEYQNPKPARPPPRPPKSKHMISSTPTTAVNGVNRYMNINPDTTVTPPPVCKEGLQLPPVPPRPERPPPPTIYYDTPVSPRPKPEFYVNESKQSRYVTSNPRKQTPDSSASCDEETIDGTDKPAVPPRARQAILPHSASWCDSSLSQTRPAVPSFSPPPPPSFGRPSESFYSEIDELPSYLEVLPGDEDRMTGRTTWSGHPTPRQKTTADSEDVYTMLQWLKRVSKSVSMAPSLYGLSIAEEIRSFNERAMNVKKALRLYNLLMMKRSERLRGLNQDFKSISASLDKMQKKTKNMSIAGGTTGAVGGVTAVLGIALAPVTMGTSLIATAVGAGMVASAGGMGAQAVKANKKIVNRMAVEKIVYAYKEKVVDLEYCLDFILSGMNELRRHDIARLHRAGAPTDALKMANLSQAVLNSSTNHRKAVAAQTGGMSSERLLQAFLKEMDTYFTEKDGQKLKKSNESKFSGRVRLLSENLQDELEHLNRMWESFC